MATADQRGQKQVENMDAPRQEKYRNLRRGGPPRKKGQLNVASREIKALAEAMTVGDQVWLESARRRMIAGEAPHLEMFFLNHKFGRPKDVDHAPDRPPIVFVSAYGPPGSYDPLARPPAAPLKAEVTSHQRFLSPSAPAGLPREAQGAGRDGGDPGADDEGEEELVVVRG
jgi:hypothetical protein